MIYVAILVAAANLQVATALASIVHPNRLVEGVVGLGALILALHPLHLRPRLHLHRLLHLGM